MVTETTCQTCWRIINHAFHHHHDIFWIIIINRLSREASCDTRAASIDITDTGWISIFDQRVGALNPLSRFFWHFRFWSNADLADYPAMSFIFVCYIYIFKSVELSDQLMLPHHPAVQLSFDGSGDQQQQNRLSREFSESRLSRWGGKSQIGKHQKLSKTRERAAKISSRIQASCFVKLWTCNELTRLTLLKTWLSLSLHLVGWVYLR